MTVALLSQWGSQPPGTLYTSDAATEAAMIARGQATATLTGAVTWVPQAGSSGNGPWPSLTAAQVGAVQGLVSGAGIPTIAAFGDSFVRAGYTWLAPWSFTPTGSIAGLTVEGLARDTTAGSKTLIYTGSTRSVVYDGGPSTILIDGYQIVQGATANTGIAVSVNVALLTGADQSMTCARSGARADVVMSARGIQAWLGVFSGQGYRHKCYGHSSGRIAAGISIVARSTAFDGFIVSYGTNDVAGGRTLPQMQADMTALMDALYAKCKRGVILAVPHLRTAFVTADYEKIESFNRWLVATVKASYKGLSVQFPWHKFADDTGAAIRTLMCTDGVHPSDACVQLAAFDLWSYFRSVLPPLPFDFGMTAGKWAGANTSGNRFANVYPAGNVAGAPTNWSASALGTGVTSTPTKVSRTDGFPGEWARLSSSGTTDNQPATYNPTPGGAAYVASSVPANGEVVQAFVEVAASGAQLMPTIRIEARLSAVAQAFAMNRAEMFAAGTGLVLSPWSGVICTPPLTWYGGHDGYSLLLQQYLHNGAASAVLDIGRVFFGTAPDLYSIET